MGLVIYPDGRIRDTRDLGWARRHVGGDNSPIIRAVRVWHWVNRPEWVDPWVASFPSRSRTFDDNAGVLEIETDQWIYRDVWNSFTVLTSASLRGWRNLHGALLWCDNYYVGELRPLNFVCQIQHERWENGQLVAANYDRTVIPEIDAVARFVLEQAKRLYDHFGIPGCKYVDMRDGVFTADPIDRHRRMVCRGIWDGFREGAEGLTVWREASTRTAEGYLEARDLAYAAVSSLLQVRMSRVGVEAAFSYAWWRG